MPRLEGLSDGRVEVSDLEEEEKNKRETEASEKEGDLE